jgi:TPR repeat protein
MRIREGLCAFMAVTLFGSFAVFAQSGPQNIAPVTGVQAAGNRASEKPQPSLGAIFENATASDRTMAMLIIKTVVDGGPADKAGMKKGDTILSLDSKSVANLSDLQGVMVGLAVGSTIKVGYLRDGQRLETEATLAEKTKLYADWYDARAQRGDSEAEFELGRIYFLGTGRSKDDTQAIYWVRKAAEQGYPNAESALGFAYLNGNAGVVIDDLSAVHWFQRAAEQGLAEAQSALAFMYVQGRGGLPKDDSQAVNWFRKAAEQGLADAQLNLGILYSAGRGGLPKDDAQAAFWWRKAADQGYVPAEVYLAKLYTTGRGIAKDQSLALNYFRSAASSGNAEAQNDLAFLLESGSEGTQDCKAAFDLYGKSAAQGWGPAIFNIGSMYFWGICGAPNDPQTAFQHYKVEADKGHALAELMVAYMYDGGIGIERDDAQAAAWYRKAADRGIPSALNNLGIKYVRGADLDEAKRLFQKAAESDDESAKFNLGCLNAVNTGDAAGCPGQAPLNCVFLTGYCFEPVSGWAFLRLVNFDQGIVPSIVQMEAFGSCGKPVTIVPPLYPPLARKLQLTGSAAANITVTNGKVSYVTVSNAKDNEGPDPLLKQAVEEAVHQWSFSPCSADENSSTRVTFVFSLAESHKIDQQAVSSAEQCYQAAGFSEVQNPGSSSWCEEGFKQANTELQEKAKDGDTKALTRMAFMYEHGQGVVKDSAEAFRRYALAAEKGDADAAFRMGRYYDEGERVAQDRSKAFKFFLQSAKSGVDSAAYRVAVMYENGVGTAKSTAEAINWYRKCQGSEEAKAALRRLVPDKQVPPDGATRAAARRAYAGILENQMRQSLRANTDVDLTLVRLRVATMTPQSSEGNTREDYRLTIESNGYALPRDVTKLLHNYSMNGQLYALGFRELSFQDTVGEQMGSVLCAVQLTEKGAHPAYCMHMENINYVGGSYGEGVWRPGWKEYYTWPADYVVTSTP